MPGVFADARVKLRQAENKLLTKRSEGEDACRYTRRGIADDNMSTRRKMTFVEKPAMANLNFTNAQCALPRPRESCGKKQAITVSLHDL